MKKRLVFLLILGLSFPLFAFSDPHKEIQQLSDRVKALEDLLAYIKFIGIPLFGLTTIWAVYMWWKGIKDKVNKIIEKDAELSIEKKAEELVKKKLMEYPFVKSYEQELKIKAEKHIAILGPTEKDIHLKEFFEKLGFQHLDSYDITAFSQVEVKPFHLFLFDNRSGKITQKQMDEVVAKYKNMVHFFYLSAEGGARWESELKDFGKIGFANSLGRLEQNILDMFK